MRKELCPARAGFAQLYGLHERHATLIDHQATCGEYARTVRIEVVGEQYFADTDRVGRIDDDYIERFVRRALHVVDTVTDNHLGTRIVPCISADFRQKLLG